MAAPMPTPRKKRVRARRVQAPDPEVARLESAKFGGAEPSPGTGFAAMRVVPEDETAAPPAAPPDPAPATPPDLEPALGMRLPTVEDIDRLWDWVRADPPGTIPGIDQVSNSQMLHTLMASLIDGEASGVSVFRSLIWQDQHVGFGYLYPIDGVDAVAHAYLGPPHRGMHARTIFRLALQAVQDGWPDLHLAIVASDPKVQRLAARLGFTRTLYVSSRPETT